jgi:hypothetical protein
MSGKLLCQVTAPALSSSVDATNAREAVRLTDLQLDKRSIEDRPSPCERLAWVACPSLTGGALTVVVLLSLGLWAVIGLVVCSLALAWQL